MHIAVDVSSKAVAQSGFTKTTHCVIVFVAVDDSGKPIPVPTWTPQSEREKSMEQYAKKLMDLRKDIEQEMAPFTRN
jgi:acyl-CoA hydrolase